MPSECVLSCTDLDDRRAGSDTRTFVHGSDVFMLAARMWCRILRLVTADNSCPPRPSPAVKRLSSLVMLLLYLAVECKRLEQVRLLTSMSRCRVAACRAILRNYMEKYPIQNQITNYVESLRRQVQDSYHDALLRFYTGRN
jgi:hypothetical protein